LAPAVTRLTVISGCSSLKAAMSCSSTAWDWPGWLLHQVISEAGSTCDQSVASVLGVSELSAPTLGPPQAVRARVVPATRAASAVVVRRRPVRG
jgi:hypothetical protein